jgi:hypothetical protein
MPLERKSLLIALLVVAAALWSIAGPKIGSAIASQGSSTAPSSASPAVPATVKSGAADAQVKQLLLLMDIDKNGKISKQEYMSYMVAEFDRLDVNKDGELDVKELTGDSAKPLRSFASGPSRPR